MAFYNADIENGRVPGFAVFESFLDFSSSEKNPPFIDSLAKYDAMLFISYYYSKRDPVMWALRSSIIILDLPNIFLSGLNE